MSGILFPRKGLHLIVFVFLFFLGFVGVISTRDAFEPLTRRYTNRMTLNNQELFKNTASAIAVYVDYPKEIIPGETATITVRGSGYLNNAQSEKVIIQVKTSNHQFVNNIEPSLKEISAPVNTEWILDALDFEVSTVNLDTPPSSVEILITEVIDINGSQSQFEEKISISVDTYVVPKTKILQLLISLFLSVLGIAGPFLLKK